jgi:hypothetical protein
MAIRLRMSRLKVYQLFLVVQYSDSRVQPSKICHFSYVTYLATQELSFWPNGKKLSKVVALLSKKTSCDLLGLGTGSYQVKFFQCQLFILPLATSPRTTTMPQKTRIELDSELLAIYCYLYVAFTRTLNLERGPVDAWLIDWFILTTDAGIAHAGLLSSYMKWRKTFRRIKTFLLPVCPSVALSVCYVLLYLDWSPA